MNQETKVILGIFGLTIAVVLGAVVFLSQPSKTGQVKETVDKSLLVRDDSYKIATSSAKVTIVEFSDFQCPACGAAHPIVKQILEQYQEKINFVYRHFPLPQHQHAQLAAQAAEAAGEEGKFWQMHDLIFQNQKEWSESSQALDLFISYAKSLGLDEEKFKKALSENKFAEKIIRDKNDFKKALSENKFAEKIIRDKNDGSALGVNSTPTFFINGQKFPGVLSLAEFRNKIEEQSAK
ncbi:thioredoxin domain-containing protein [Candidatus Microgenomates bacterium]|nr:thioredoxin domain-containing protein [Candidatus Microgenomates bacterium]